jgi:hypothetical protein
MNPGPKLAKTTGTPARNPALSDPSDATISIDAADVP